MQTQIQAEAYEEAGVQAEAKAESQAQAKEKGVHNRKLKHSYKNTGRCTSTSRREEKVQAESTIGSKSRRESGKQRNLLQEVWTFVDDAVNLSETLTLIALVCLLP